MRAYLPSTPLALAQALAAGRFPAGQAFAVTPGLRALDPDSDEEEHEFLASMLAADSSLAAQAGLDTEGPVRRVVVSVDVPDEEVAVVDDATGEIQIAVEPALQAVAAVHVDDDEAEAALRTALADGELDPLDERALSWFDPTELADLVASWGLAVAAPPEVLD
jgi:hypothetical protein